MLSVIGEKNPHNITCDNRKGFTGWTQMLYVEEESVFDLLEEKKKKKKCTFKVEGVVAYCVSHHELLKINTIQG